MALTKNDLKIALKGLGERIEKRFREQDERIDRQFKEQDSRFDKKLTKLRKAINLDIAGFLNRTVIKQLDGVQVDLNTIDRRLDKIDDRLEDHEKRIKTFETPKLA